jgi:cyclase
MTMKRLQITLAAAVVAAGSLAVHSYAQQASGDIHVLKVQGNVYMLVGDGANIAASVGKDGVFLVDGGTAELSDKLLATLKTLTDKPVHYIVNTSVDADHVGGNSNIARNGAPVMGGNLQNSNRGAAIVARENVLTRMSAPTGQKAAYPGDAWPTVTWFEGNKEIFFNSEAVVTMPAERAHTDGDSIVYFRRSDVIAAGDIFRDDTFPAIDLERGGNVQGVLDGLNHILDIAIPEHEQEGGTYIIPGHGRLTDEHDVLEYRDMVTIVRDRVQAMIKKGMTLDQVKAAKPTFEYDRRWSAPSGLNSSSGFVEAVYKSLKK